MFNQNDKSALLLGFFIFLGLSLLGYFIGSSLIKFKEYERTVTVKGLSERELPADIVIWPIQFTGAGNNLTELYAALERDSGRIVSFLKTSGIAEGEITVSPPGVTDRLAQQY
ncbi:MAG TPA: SIMPL domain-containing protein, partial [Gammaproteobacteria bacterium]